MASWHYCNLHVQRPVLCYNPFSFCCPTLCLCQYMPIPNQCFLYFRFIQTLPFLMFSIFCKESYCYKRRTLHIAHWETVRRDKMSLSDKAEENRKAKAWWWKWWISSDLQISWPQNSSFFKYIIQSKAWAKERIRADFQLEILCRRRKPTLICTHNWPW